MGKQTASRLSGELGECAGSCRMLKPMVLCPHFCFCMRCLRTPAYTTTAAAFSSCSDTLGTQNIVQDRGGDDTGRQTPCQDPGVPQLLRAGSERTSAVCSSTSSHHSSPARDSPIPSCGREAEGIPLPRSQEDQPLHKAWMQWDGWKGGRLSKGFCKATV